MRNFVRGFIVAAIVLAAGVAVSQVVYSPPNSGTSIFAEVLKPGGTTDTGALRTASRGVQLFDSVATCAVGAACNTGVLDTSGFDGIHVSVYNSGSATSAACNLQMVRADASVLTIRQVTTVANGQQSNDLSWCPGCGAPAGTGAGAPLPPKVQVACAGTANATLRITVNAR